MQYSIRQVGDRWQVICDGAVVYEDDDKVAALAYLAGALYAARPMPMVEGDAPTMDDVDPNDPTLLAAWWVSDPASDNESALELDRRDFSSTTWSWRDVNESTLPLMLHDVNTPGHDQAMLAGFTVEVALGPAGKPRMRGRYYATAVGRQVRDMLANGKRFGVSVDGGPNTQYEFVCTEEDEWGCVDGVTRFIDYEIAGLTVEPFPRIAGATITEGGADGFADAQAEDESMAAAGAWRPSRAWFYEPEPSAGDPRLVPQRGGALAVPLTITDDGQLYGHLCFKGQAHLGFQHVKKTAPPSSCNYAEFMLHPITYDDGSTDAVGVLLYGCDHVPALKAGNVPILMDEARDAYAHTGAIFAKVRVVDGVFGPWVAGAVLPDTPAEALDVIGQLSGDWRPMHGIPGIELCAIQAVPVPGFGIRRIAASGRMIELEAPKVSALVRSGEVCQLIGGNVVCGTTAIAAAASHDCGCGSRGLAARMDSMAATLAVLEMRTRPESRRPISRLRAMLERDA